MGEGIHCYECGRIINESQPTVFADGKTFHKSCAVTLQCYDCRRVVGYQVTESLFVPNVRVTKRNWYEITVLTT